MPLNNKKKQDQHTKLGSYSQLKDGAETRGCQPHAVAMQLRIGANLDQTMIRTNLMPTGVTLVEEHLAMQVHTILYYIGVTRAVT